MKGNLFLAVIVLFFTACSSPDTRVQTSVEVPVSVEDLVPKPIEEFVVTTGTVMATMDALMKSESAGYYRLAVNAATSRPFALGDLVKKDQVILYLDNQEREVAIKIESSKLDLANTESNVEKQKSLFEKGGVTQSDLKTAERQYVDSKYNYENALIQLRKLKITAPFDGLIVDLPYYTRGILIPSNTDLVHIMNYSKLNMEISLPGKLMDEVKEGQSVRVMNYTMPDKILQGILSQVSPALDPSTRTFKATVNIDNPDWLLRPGMFVKAEITTARNDSTIVIPKDVILARRNRKTVFVVDRGVAQERVIITGLENPDEIEVTQGLSLNERLVVQGFETLRNGSRVTITR